MPPTPKIKNYEILKNYKNKTFEKSTKTYHFSQFGLRECQNRIQHVHKSVHAKYELCSCLERRVMTIWRPPGPKIMQNMSFVAARGCQERPPGAKFQEQLVAANPRSHAIFQIFYSCSCFWMFNWQPFLDLINSKDCTHEYNLLNCSDLKKVAKTFFKHTKYQSEKENIFF